ncbi:hypothetical protein U5N28_16240 [Lysinibacillus telephonicus]|uniref:hypothetical protein n=1 Tax=Lysinibacillus telephonicus TaxID=1714840 RepID=UPI00397814BE
MGLVINYSNEGVRISGDDHLKEKLPEGFDVSEIDLTSERINAESLATAYGYAQYKGIETIKFYFALKDAFLKQQELAKLSDYERSTVENMPAITTQSIKPINA